MPQPIHAKEFLSVDDVMTTLPLVVPDTMSVTEALTLVIRNDFHHLPVRARGFIGIVSERDLQLACASVTTHFANVGNLIREEPIIIDSGMPLTYALRRMTEEQKDCVLVRSKDDQLIGIFTATDATRALYLLLSGRDLKLA